ncbi:hypothetical protein C7G41_26195 [Bradyrhizobium sp. MOS002]|nr:hypothetical protein C7G41_26195 [Bradyrhizobium sp. MOS002]
MCSNSPLPRHSWTSRTSLRRGIRSPSSLPVIARRSDAAALSTVIASAAKQSRLSPRRDSGLLRCARNDGECGNPGPSPLRNPHGFAAFPGLKDAG